VSQEYDRWEGRYDIEGFLFGEEPNYFLKACEHLIPTKGAALAVADGEGRNGVWLAERGLATVSIDFSPTAQVKARTLTSQRGVEMEIIETDVHTWDYPDAGFDLVAEIFTQFSSPEQRTQKWAGMIKALKPGGLMIIQGYTPKQLEYGTGGPGKVENLYTSELLAETFGGFDNLVIEEEELEFYEGQAHGGMSAVIKLTGNKPG
jgi:SAM-dependent methyltransferase